MYTRHVYLFLYRGASLPLRPVLSSPATAANRRPSLTPNSDSYANAKEKRGRDRGGERKREESRPGVLVRFRQRRGFLVGTGNAEEQFSSRTGRYETRRQTHNDIKTRKESIIDIQSHTRSHS